MEEKDTTGSSLLYSESEQAQSRSHIKAKSSIAKFAILATALLIMIGAGAYVWFNPSPLDRDEISSEEEILRAAQEELVNIYATQGVAEAAGVEDSANYGLDLASDELPAPSGVLVFTGRNPSMAEQVSIYFLDLVTGVEYIPAPFIKNNIFLFAEFDNVLSPTKMFLDTITDKSSRSVNLILGVHEYDVASDSYRYLKSADGITEARELALSPAKTHLAFARTKNRPLTFVDMLEVKDWEIVILDPKADVVLATLDEATHPEWSPDGNKLVYMKADGLYVYDLQTDASTLVRPVEDEKQLINVSMIDISPNGEYLAWTFGHMGLISMNRITNWDDFTMEEIGRITLPNTHVLWPQFSPDSQYYAVQAIDAPKEGTTERENPRFEIRPTLGRDVVISHATDGFNFTEFHTDTWITADPTLTKSDGEEPTTTE